MAAGDRGRVCLSLDMDTRVAWYQVCVPVCLRLLIDARPTFQDGVDVH